MLLNQIKKNIYVHIFQARTFEKNKIFIISANLLKWFLVYTFIFVKINFQCHRNIDCVSNFDSLADIGIRYHIKWENTDRVNTNLQNWILIYLKENLLYNYLQKCY